MSLIDSLNGAKLAVVDSSRRLVYAWFGGAGVNIYDEDGSEVDYFTIGGDTTNLTCNRVRYAIARMMDYKR